MMTAKELIEALEEFIEEYGDQDIYLADWVEEYCQPAPLGVVDRRSYGIVLST